MNKTGLYSGEEMKGKNPNATLTEEDVFMIRERAAGGMPAKKLAEFFNVGVETVRRVIRRETWAWVGGGKGKKIERDSPVISDDEQAMIASKRKLAALLTEEGSTRALAEGLLSELTGESNEPKV